MSVCVCVCVISHLPGSRLDVDCAPPAGQCALHPQEEVPLTALLCLWLLTQTWKQRSTAHDARLASSNHHWVMMIHYTTRMITVHLHIYRLSIWSELYDISGVYVVFRGNLEQCLCCDNKQCLTWTRSQQVPELLLITRMNKVINTLTQQLQLWITQQHTTTVTPQQKPMTQFEADEAAACFKSSKSINIQFTLRLSFSLVTVRVVTAPRHIAGQCTPLCIYVFSYHNTVMPQWWTWRQTELRIEKLDELHPAGVAQTGSCTVPTAFSEGTVSDWDWLRNNIHSVHSHKVITFPVILMTFCSWGDDSSHPPPSSHHHEVTDSCTGVKGNVGADF